MQNYKTHVKFSTGSNLAEDRLATEQELYLDSPFY